jgi:hypothetical protein
MYKIQKTEIRGLPVIKARFTGDFNLTLVLKFIDRMAEYEERCPGNRLLVDCTAVSKVSIDFEDMKSIVQYVRDNDQRLGKTAFVTGAGFGRYLLARLFVDLVAFSDLTKKMPLNLWAKLSPGFVPKAPNRHNFSDKCLLQIIAEMEKEHEAASFSLIASSG